MISSHPSFKSCLYTEDNALDISPSIDTFVHLLTFLHVNVQALTPDVIGGQQLMSWFKWVSTRHGDVWGSPQRAQQEKTPRPQSRETHSPAPCPSPPASPPPPH